MTSSLDSITPELIRSSLLYGSEEMGIALRNSSFSPNIKERMDHSAALFDAEGRLLAQAEHVPVHLGSLPWGMRTSWITVRNRRLSSKRIRCSLQTIRIFPEPISMT